MKTNTANGARRRATSGSDASAASTMAGASRSLVPASDTAISSSERPERDDREGRVE